VEKLNLELPKDVHIVPIGATYGRVETFLIVQSSADVGALDMGSLLCLADRTILGEVFETFGPVAQPLYSVRYNSPEEIPTELGLPVFFVPQHAKFVLASELRTLKGSDASNCNDEEVGEEVCFFFLRSVRMGGKKKYGVIR
jgi:H/ACA ribonucleoprotein complex non-core subunit NAF1